MKLLSSLICAILVSVFLSACGDIDQQYEKDDRLIKEYLINHNMTNAIKTSSGLYYLITDSTQDKETEISGARAGDVRLHRRAAVLYKG